MRRVIELEVNVHYSRSGQGGVKEVVSESKSEAEVLYVEARGEEMVSYYTSVFGGRQARYKD
jgi:hypothetical protein